MKFYDLITRTERPPTWAERDQITRLRQEGVEDVLLDISEAPDEFWRAALRASDIHLARHTASSKEFAYWSAEYLWRTDLPDFAYASHETYPLIVRDGRLVTRGRSSTSERKVTAGERLTALEVMMDSPLIDDARVLAFVDAVNDKARWLRVGIAIEDKRFVPLASQHQHEELVRPTLLLLNDPTYEGADALYRKAFDRVLGGDASGAITNAAGAVEEFLRIALEHKGGELKTLLAKAKDRGLVIPAVEQVAVKLQALREESDAHKPGTDDPSVAMFAVHTASAILLHLAERASR